MDIIVTYLTRGHEDIYEDNGLVGCKPDNHYDVGFIAICGESVVVSQVHIEHKGELTFSKAEQLVRAALSIQNKE